MALEPAQVVSSGDVDLAVYVWDAPAERAGTKRAPARGRKVVRKPTVVLVHGYPDAATVWTTVAEGLAERYRVIAYDVRGAGRSSVPTRLRDYDMDCLVADLAAVIDVMSRDQPVHLIAHDWGSIQAWEAVTTERLGGRIASYTTISGPSLDHAAHWIRRRLKSGSLDQYRQVGRQLAHSWYVGMFHLPGLAPTLWKVGLDRLWPGLLEQLDGVRVDASDSQRKDGMNGVNLYRANFGKRLLKPAERRTEIPVQLIVPRQDRFMVGEIWDDLPQWVPNLWRRETDAGHWIQWSHPQRVIDWTSEFIDHVEGARETPALARARSHARTSRSSQQSDRQRGRLVVVTGAGSGFGRETALLFARHGADIVCVDINREAAEHTVEQIRQLGAQAWARVVDVGSVEQMTALADGIEADFGAPDIVVNNAGIGIAGSFFDTSDADWERVLRVNLWGVIHGSKLFGRQMIKAGRRGHIVNVASMGGFTPSKFMSAYNTSKAAVLMLGDCLRAELADKGIHVATICPGLSITNITQSTRFVGLSPEQQADKQARVTRLYQRRNLTPDRIAEAILDAVEHRRNEVPVGAEARGARLISRLLPSLSQGLARLDLVP